jgi:hypothetical protein
MAPRRGVALAAAAAQRAAPSILLALALAVGCCRAAHASAPPLISPSFQFGLPNTTSNWTASEPVTWSLLTRDNTHRVIGAVSGYAELYITSTTLEVLAGQQGGVYHVRALRNSCADEGGTGCVATCTWVVLSYAEMAGLGLAAAALCVLCCFGVVRRLQPAPETEEEKRWRATGLGIAADYYGTFLSGGEAAPNVERGSPRGTELPRRPPAPRRMGVMGNDRL